MLAFHGVSLRRDQKGKNGLFSTCDQCSCRSNYICKTNYLDDCFCLVQGDFRKTICNKIVFKRHKRFKETREFVRDDGRNKEVNRPELIGQRVRVSILKF